MLADRGQVLPSHGEQGIKVSVIVPLSLLTLSLAGPVCKTQVPVVNCEI